MADIGSSLGDIGGAVGDLFGAAGSLDAAGAYTKAEQIAKTNEQLTLTSGQIQEQQLGIKTFQSEGAEKAETAGAGFSTASGSAGDLLRSSAEQASLSKQLLNVQTQVTAGGFAQQASAYAGQAAAAQKQAGGGFLGGALKLAGAALPFLLA